MSAKVIDLAEYRRDMSAKVIDLAEYRRTHPPKQSPYEAFLAAYVAWFLGPWK